MRALIILPVILSAAMAFAKSPASDKGKKVSKPAQRTQASKPVQKQTTTIANSQTCNRASFSQDIMLKSKTNPETSKQQEKVAAKKANVDT